MSLVGLAPTSDWGASAHDSTVYDSEEYYSAGDGTGYDSAGDDSADDGTGYDSAGDDWHTDHVHGGDKSRTAADYRECMSRQPAIPDSDPGAVGKRSSQENKCLSEANQKANARDQQRGYEEQQRAYQQQLADYNAQQAAAASKSSGSSAASKAVAADAAVEVGAGLLATIEIWLPALIVIAIIWIIVCVALVFIAHWWWPGWSWETSLWAGVIAFFAPMLILGGLGAGAYLIHRSRKKKAA